MRPIRSGVELSQHLGFAHVRAVAQAAERLGYDSVWVKDHLIVSPHEMTQPQQRYIADGGQTLVSGTYLSCLPTVAALATVTERVLLGTDILNIPRRNPVDVANETAAIDHISDGRFILHGAIGQPTRDWDPLGLRSTLKERGEMLEEALRIITALWTSDEPTTFRGKHFAIEGARIGSRPSRKPHPPIWLGIEKTFKRVARLASGFTLTSTMYGGAAETYVNAIRRISAEARRIGRDPAGIEAAARFAVVIDEDGAAAKRRAADHWAKIRGREEAWHTAWAGDPAHVARVIEPFVRAGASHILLYPLPYAALDASRDLELFAREVMPRVRELAG